MALQVLQQTHATAKSPATDATDALQPMHLHMRLQCVHVVEGLAAGFTLVRPRGAEVSGGRRRELDRSGARALGPPPLRPEARQERLWTLLLGNVSFEVKLCGSVGAANAGFHLVVKGLVAMVLVLLALNIHLEKHHRLLVLLAYGFLTPAVEAQGRLFFHRSVIGLKG